MEDCGVKGDRIGYVGPPITGQEGQAGVCCIPVEEGKGVGGVDLVHYVRKRSLDLIKKVILLHKRTTEASLSATQPAKELRPFVEPG